MKFRAPTFHSSKGQDENEFRAMPFKRAPTTPVPKEQLKGDQAQDAEAEVAAKPAKERRSLLRKKSKANVNNDAQEEVPPVPTLSKKARSKTINNADSDAPRTLFKRNKSAANLRGESPEETPPDVPPMPFLKQNNSSMTNLSSTANEEMSVRPAMKKRLTKINFGKDANDDTSMAGFKNPWKASSKVDLTNDAEAEVPRTPVALKKASTMIIDTNTSRFSFDADEAPKSANPARKSGFRDMLNMRTKIERRMTLRQSKVVKRTLSHSSSIRASDSAIERALTAQGDVKPNKSVRDRRKSTRQSMRKPVNVNLDVPPVDLSKVKLSVDQIRSMSIGAPAFGVEEHNGRYKPQVIFRGSNAETSAEFQADYQKFGHSSFRACTLRLDVSAETVEALSFNYEDLESSKPTADLAEVPSMLSAHGLDLGAVGFEHFLQLSIADDAVRTDDSDVTDKRQLLQSEPKELGLRPWNVEGLLSRLSELEELLPASKDANSGLCKSLDGAKIDEMGVQLFETLLTPDSRTPGAATRGTTMKKQIHALQKVLRTSGLWHDFGFVKWRIRVGQLLWNEKTAESINVDDNGPCERDVILLQITLAAELLLRINIIKLSTQIDPPIIFREEYEMLEAQRTTKIDWDLLLAERFFDNVDICTKPTDKQNRNSYRNSLLNAIPFLNVKDVDGTKEQPLRPRLAPKHETQQLQGLLHFAEVLQWPHAHELPTQLDTSPNPDAFERRNSEKSTYVTPLSSPLVSQTPFSRDSAFGFGLDPEKLALSKTTTAEKLQLTPARHSNPNKANFEECGWLSRSWMSGFIMPGEAASQFLISTMLENSPPALSTLGKEANMYGGFVYEGRSYWSKNCVVGRVLAAKRGATECMEWLSIPGLAEGQEDGWVDLAVKEMPESRSKPRIVEPEAVASDSDLLHNKGLTGSKAGDFIWPTDGDLVMSNEVICQGLSFNPAMKMPEHNHEDGSATRSVATLTFGSMIKRKLTVVEMPLTYDAWFVSSYPCHPKTTKSKPASQILPYADALYTGVSVAPSPTVSSIDQKESTNPLREHVRSSTALERPKTAPAPSDSGYGSKTTSESTISFSSSHIDDTPPPTHPLHKDYHYDIVPVTTLFTTATETRPRALSDGAERQPGTHAPEKDVMVLDCRGPTDLEFFARAWCSKVGENAVIGKSGRTCLACCVREARALGICVVIRT